MMFPFGVAENLDGGVHRFGAGEDDSDVAAGAFDLGSLEGSVRVL
jgi:hypothetical protein